MNSHCTAWLYGFVAGIGFSGIVMVTMRLFN